MTLNCCTFEFSRNFASKRCWVLYSDSPGGATIPTLSRADLCLSWAFLLLLLSLLSRTQLDHANEGTVSSSRSSFPGESGDELCVDGVRHNGINKQFLWISFIRLRTLNTCLLVQPAANTRHPHSHSIDVI